MTRILLVDDDVDFCSAVQTLLRAQSYDVDTVGTVEQASNALAKSSYDILLVDISLPDGTGFELLSDDGPNAVVITGHPSVETAVRAVRGPVVDYLVKPVDRDQLYRTIKQATRRGATEESKDGKAETSKIVGESEPIRDLRQAIADFGPTDATILITGESGTGKELVAEALHAIRSPDAVMVTVNCGAIPKELIASELFGHEKGAFTGATTRHEGVFERAGDGTVFLDEIGDLPAEQQVALLRVLESSTVMRVGGKKAIPVSARVVSATNTDLEKLVRDGDFRKDLYFRLMVLPIRTPPLRERTDDVPVLTRYFLEVLAQQYKTPVEMAPGLMERLQSYHWPGNVRELKHVLLRAGIMNRQNKRIESLPSKFDQPFDINAGIGSIRPGLAIRDVERTLILKTLEHFDGNRKETAEALGVSQKTLYNRLRQYEDGFAEDRQSYGS